MIRVVAGDLRTRNREATATRILDAVHRVLADEHPATLSMPRVAEEAGVGLRTLYRYFPTKESLVDAASHSFAEEAVAAMGGRPTVATLSDYLQVTWSSFSDSLAAVKAQHLTPAGRELRAARLPRSRAHVRAAMIDEGVDLPDEDLDRLVDLVVLITSSSAYLELVDRLGHADVDAAKLAAWAAGAVVARARNEGAVAR